ncbi:MAG: DUF3467 domain-containing protein [Bacteroidales bacterium]|nr:DUF3467 domain-containing protein [Bacteroidales bacterium]
MDQNKNKIDIELTPDIASGVYSNLQIVQHSPTEFIVDFIQIAPGVPKAQVKSRVILSPVHAKALLKALQDNIVRYEQNNGPIKDNISQPNINNINPMGLA